MSSKVDHFQVAKTLTFKTRLKPRFRMIATIAVIGKWFPYDRIHRCFLSDRSDHSDLRETRLKCKTFSEK